MYERKFSSLCQKARVSTETNLLIKKNNVNDKKEQKSTKEQPKITKEKINK